MCLFIVAAFVFAGCSKKNDPGPDTGSKKSMKFTFTVTGSDLNDEIEFHLTAGNHDASQYGAPVWKVNGVTQGNEDDLFLTKRDFAGNTKTYVVETVKAFNFGALNVHYTIAEDSPVTISYKAEIGGKVETNVENLVVAAGQSQNKNFTYQ